VAVDSDRLGFRPLGDDDLPMLHRWLNEPDVVRWWEGDDVSWDGVQDRYGAERREHDSVEMHVVTLDGRPVGWMQCWFLADEDEMQGWVEHGFDPATAAGIDYLVASPSDRGVGLGTAMIDAYVARVVFGEHPWITAVGSDPDDGNERSWRALAAAGFRPVGRMEWNGRTYRLMRRDRDPAGPGPRPDGPDEAVTSP
jgi:RimJ/RimL family protein N-acetyltransferase